MENYKPNVNKNREFKEIAADFSNPLDSIREGISNSIDAKSKEININASIEKIDFQNKLVLVFEDDGIGMDKERIKSFFDLGNSSWNDASSIGEKGHGTKIFYRSESLEVATVDLDGNKIVAKVDRPWITLNNEKSEFRIEISDSEKVENTKHGTKIKIVGFYDNKASFFEHKKIKDYIKWFTAFGSIKRFFKEEMKTKLNFKGVDVKEFESLNAGHQFPEEATLDKI